MDKQRYPISVKEGIKSLLILLLACSAVFLAVRVFRSGTRVDVLIQGPVGTQTQTLSADSGKIAWPMRLAAALPGDAGVERYGIQYNIQESDAFFQQTASLLSEALSSAEAPQKIDEGQWRSVLRSGPGIYFDFQGDLPLTVLAGWLSDQSCALEGTVRKVALAIVDGQVLLCYRDVRNGQFYACRTDVVNPDHLWEVTEPLTGNGAQFAFEMEEYGVLEPYTLLLSETPQPRIYRASSAIGATTEDLVLLMEELHFPVESTAFYAAGDEQVARNGEESIRLSKEGVVVYQCDGSDSGRYHVARQGETASLLEMAEGCRALAQQSIGSRCGEARLYLLSVQSWEQGWQFTFGYSLNGIPVQMEEGFAARFFVRDGQILSFSLNFRSYSDSGETALMLPEFQAMAAMESLGHAGEELVLIYPDRGGETIFPVWAAAGTISDAGNGG
ncbi:MAG: hypothetical protein IKK44_02940 [Clostridium sp.]|nr:hypothetical protein [Clostridium sp.]